MIPCAHADYQNGGPNPVEAVKAPVPYWAARPNCDPRTPERRESHRPSPPRSRASNEVFSMLSNTRPPGAEGPPRDFL